MLPLLLAAVAAACGAEPTQAGLDRCACAAYVRAERALDAEWRRTLAARAGGRTAPLRAEQRAWLRRRDARCAAENASSVGGSMHAAAVAECRTRLTQARTAELRARDPSR